MNFAHLLPSIQKQGTWPMDGGGVATCRQQLIEGTKVRARWQDDVVI